MTQDKKVLILGSSGFLGRRMFAALGPGKAVATYNNTPLAQGVFFNSLTMKLADIVDEPASISHAVILLGDTKPDSCAADVQKSHALNVDSIKAILDQLKSWGIKPVFTSTEVIFDGVKGNYLETDEANPILTYGKQKIEVEQYLERNFGDHLIVRPALIYGAQPGDGTILTGWLDSITRGDTSHCAYDYIASPILIDDVVSAIELLMRSDAKGIFHLSGHSAYSRLDLYRIILDQVNEYSPVDLEPVSCSIHDFNLREKRPLNVSMRPDKLVAATGIAIKDVKEVCRDLVKNAFEHQPSG